GAGSAMHFAGASRPPTRLVLQAWTSGGRRAHSRDRAGWQWQPQVFFWSSPPPLEMADRGRAGVPAYPQFRWPRRVPRSSFTPTHRLASAAIRPQCPPGGAHEPQPRPLTRARIGHFILRMAPHANEEDPMKQHKLFQFGLAALVLAALAVLTVSPAAAAPPPNDNFSSATVVSVFPFSATVTITEATTEN